MSKKIKLILVVTKYKFGIETNVEILFSDFQGIGIIFMTNISDTSPINR